MNTFMYQEEYSGMFGEANGFGIRALFLQVNDRGGFDVKKGYRG